MTMTPSLEKAVEQALDTLTEICDSTDSKTMPFNPNRMRAAEAILEYAKTQG